MPELASESVFRIGFLNITNALLGTLLTDIIVLLCVFLVRNLKLVPNLFQNIIETVIETFYNLTESIAQSRTAKIFPYFMSFFIFILFANWSGIIPGVGTIGFFEEKKLIPLFRGPASDLNTTLALALVSAIATHSLSIKMIGIKHYLSRFFSLNPINLFVGILEIISEITKVVSLSFRLYGNIFAGEVVLVTTAGIFAFLFPVPFLLLEVVVGLVQALVFSMLTMAFMTILTTPHEEETHSKLAKQTVS